MKPNSMSEVWTTHIKRCVESVKADIEKLPSKVQPARLGGITDATDSIMRIFFEAGLDESFKEILIQQKERAYGEWTRTETLLKELRERTDGLFDPTDKLEGRGLEAVYLTQALVKTFKETLPSERGEMDSTVAREMLRSVSYIVWAVMTGQAELPNGKEV